MRQFRTVPRLTPVRLATSRLLSEVDNNSRAIAFCSGVYIEHMFASLTDAALATIALEGHKLNR